MVISRSIARYNKRVFNCQCSHNRAQNKEKIINEKDHRKIQLSNDMRVNKMPTKFILFIGK